MVKAFHRRMKVFLAPEVKKSVLELAFTKFGFLDLANFVAIDRFLILLSPPTPPPVPALAGAS